VRFGWLVSLVLHALAVGVAYISWPSDPPETVSESAVVPVEVITFADRSNVSPIAPETPVEPMDEVAVEGAPQELEKIAPPNAPEAFKPEPTPQKPTKSKESLNLDALAALLDKSKTDQGRRDPTTSPGARAEPGERPRQGFGDQTGLTATEIDALRAQVERCWRAPADMANPERLVVKVRVRFNRDGSVQGPPEVVSPPSGDAQWRAAADNAVRAVRLCAPYTLPPERYSRWSEVTMNFDPRLMSGE
jgi:hypothetical protein